VECAVSVFSDISYQFIDIWVFSQHIAAGCAAQIIYAGGIRARHRVTEGLGTLRGYRVSDTLLADAANKGLAGQIAHLITGSDIGYVRTTRFLTDPPAGANLTDIGRTGFVAYASARRKITSVLLTGRATHVAAASDAAHIVVSVG
jgi:hypothetical protein